MIHSEGKSDIHIPFFAIGCVGFATLLFEILLTRVFSVTMWYHFAFMAISLALLGIATSGIAVMISPKLSDSENTLYIAGLSSVGLALTIPLSFLIDLHIPFIPFDSSIKISDGVFMPYLIFFIKFIILAVPFFFAGLVIAVSFTNSTFQINRIYFADLFGGGLGCILAVPILYLISAPGAIVLLASLGFLSAIICFKKIGKNILISLSAFGLIATIIFVGLNENYGWIKIKNIKSYNPDFGQTIERPKIYERWHPVSRIAVHPVNVSGSPIYWFYSHTVDNFPKVMEVTNDGGARSYIYPQLNLDQYQAIFRDDVSDIAFSLLNEAEVLIVGVGGGKDVLSSLAFGARRVTAVELNPHMIDIVQNVFSNFTGKPFDNPRVHVVIDEGRNFIASHTNKYDLIKISLTDTWAASYVGAYALVENYLYTREALEDFLSHLKEGGFLSITRFYPQESLRLVSLAVAVLQGKGYKEPESHLVMVRNPLAATLIIKNGRYNAREISLLENAVQKAGHTVIYAPLQSDMLSDTNYDILHRKIILKTNSKDFSEEAFPVNISPPTDNKPFFFNFVTFADVQKGKYGSEGGFIRQHSRGLSLLLGLLKISIVISIIFILAPLLLFKNKSEHTIPIHIYFSTTLYFLALGLGYLLVEIPLIQRFILFLGHPVYALTVVLFSLLISSAFGSLLSHRISLNNKMLLSIVTFSCVLILFIAGRFLSDFLRAEIRLPISKRIVLSVLIIVPIGLLMGIPFPTGLRAISRISKTLVPWAWAVNGIGSVTAPIMAMIVAIVWGFSTTFYLGAVTYAVASIILLFLLVKTSK